MSVGHPILDLSPLDEAHPPLEPGHSEYAVKRAIRDLIRVYGLTSPTPYEDARDHVADVLWALGGRTIEHERAR